MIDDTDFARYLDVLHHGTVREAVHLATTLAARGTPPDVLLDQLVGRALAEVGRGWAAGAWSVAEEHRATSTSQAVVGALRPAPPDAGPGVVLACPDGEWHSMPAEILAHRLHLRGVRVRALGPSVAADDVAAALAEEQPVALLLSCTVLSSLPAAAQTVDVAARAGVPTVLGGAAVDAAGARRLGAAARPEDPDAVAALLRRWQALPPARPGGAPDVRGHRIAALRHDLVLAALLDVPRGGTGDALAVRHALRTALEEVVDVLAAAVLVGDRGLVATHLEALAGRHHVAPAAPHLPSALAALGRAVEVELPELELDLRDDLAAIGLS
jgi:methanogenic corrinoid protein MtbC1